MLFTNQIEKLCGLGVNVTISANSYLTNNLERFAFLSHQSGGTLTIKNCEKLPSNNLEKIASIGQNNVTFDFTQ